MKANLAFDLAAGPNAGAHLLHKLCPRGVAFFPRLPANAKHLRDFLWRAHVFGLFKFWRVRQGFSYLVSKRVFISIDHAAREVSAGLDYIKGLGRKGRHVTTKPRIHSGVKTVIKRGVGLSQLGLNELYSVVQILPKGLDKDFLFAAKVQVEALLRKLGRSRDLLYRGSLKAVAAEDRDGCN